MLSIFLLLGHASQLIIVGPRHVSECEGLLNQETLLPLFKNFPIWCSGPDWTISHWFPGQKLFFFNGHCWPGLTNPCDISDSFNGTPLVLTTMQRSPSLKEPPLPFITNCNMTATLVLETRVTLHPMLGTSSMMTPTTMNITVMKTAMTVTPVTLMIFKMSKLRMMPKDMKIGVTGMNTMTDCILHHHYDFL